jgi:hypothetical protein
MIQKKKKVKVLDTGGTSEWEKSKLYGIHVQQRYGHTVHMTINEGNRYKRLN